METSRLWLVVLIGVNLVCVSLTAESLVTAHPDLRAQNQKLCNELARDPYFDVEMVVGTPWRIYYTWNMDLGPHCIDINFKIATPPIIRRFYYDMHEYLEEQPAWGAASLVMKMGELQREMLLFDDQGPAGKFIAVPNIIRSGSMTYIRSPLFHFQVKLERNGKYLIFLDCQIGLASISARADPPPDRAEIQSLAATLGLLFGEGYNACVEQKDLAST